MKRATYLLACVLLVSVAWLNLSPVRTQAQQDYGPYVASELLEFDEVYKTAATHDLIDGVPRRTIRIVSMFVRSLSDTANNVYFNEEGESSTFLGTNSTDVEAFDRANISGTAGWVIPPGSWKTTTTIGKGIQVTLSEAQPIAITGTYVLVNTP